MYVSKPTLKNRKLTNTVTTSKELTKYIKQKQLFLEYENEIHANESILNIPMTATLLPLAWLTGSDIYIDIIDQTFKESMDKLKTLFQKMYPKASFKTEIIAEKLVKNHLKVENRENRTGLMFSGGVDSMYSLINNINKKPNLIMMWGADNFQYPEHAPHWKKTISIYKQFAQEKDLSLDIIKTNITQILDLRRIEHQYHQELYNGSLRSGISHSLLLLPAAAPLSEGRFNQMIIAASYTPEFDLSRSPRAAVPELDEMINWANVSVIHDGFISRKEKIDGISQYYKNNGVMLRVCLRSEINDGKINDSKCEKCRRTIASLVLAGIDPNECGFTADETFFKDLRRYWENRTAVRYGSWLEIQRLIPDKLEDDFQGSKEFFEWFRGFDFKTTEKNWFFVDLYMRLPYSFAKGLDMIYRKFHINVHENPFIR